MERASFGELESNNGCGMDQEWRQGFSTMEGMEFAAQIGKAHRALEPLPGSTPNFINQSETVRNHSTLCSGVLKLPTKSFYQPHNHMNHVNENQILEMETKSLMHENDQKNHNIELNCTRGTSRSETYNCPSSTLCSGVLKLPTKSFYRSSNHMNHVTENQILEMETKSLMHENSQKNHNTESKYTRGTSRSGTCNCPSSTSCSGTLKYTTKSYSYSNSSEDESERTERKEKERYERKLIREHLRQKSKDQSPEYCLESFEYAGHNLADTDETDGGITLSDWSEPEPNDDNEEDEIFVGYFEDSEALQEDNESDTNDPRLTQSTGIYGNLRQTDQKPIYLNLQRTEIPIPPRAPKGEGLKQYILPEPMLSTEPALFKVKQEVQEAT